MAQVILALDVSTPLKMSEETDPEIFEAFPDAIATIHCYPNPFNDQTEITMSLSKDALVTVWISDIGGKRVAMIADENFYKPGEWKWMVSLPELAAGSYFAVVGSSRKTILGLLINVVAIENRCFCPPDSSLYFDLPLVSSPTKESISKLLIEVLYKPAKRSSNSFNIKFG